MTEREADERIRLALPEGWAATPADLLTISAPDGESIRWHVVLSRRYELDDADESMGTIDVDVIGQTLEDVLSTIPRLEAIGEAVRVPWRVALQVEADAVRTAAAPS